MKSPRHTFVVSGLFHALTSLDHKEERHMEAATKVAPPTPGYDPYQHIQTPSQRNLASLMNVALTRPKWLTPARTAKTTVATGLATGAYLTVREVIRHRRRLADLERNQSTILGYIQALINETSCGEDAYIFLQVQAEELDVDERPKPDEEQDQEREPALDGSEE